MPHGIVLDCPHYPQSVHNFGLIKRPILQAFWLNEPYTKFLVDSRTIFTETVIPDYQLILILTT